MLNLAASAHIIEMTGDRSSLRFYHQLLQEFFAGYEMLKRDPDTLEDLWRWPWLAEEMPKWDRPDGNYDPLPPPPHTNWEETTILAAGLMPENDDQLVRALTRVDPVLAGRSLHEGKAIVAPENRQKVIDQLLGTVSDPKVALRVRIAAGDVLGYLGDPRLGELVPIEAGEFLMGDEQHGDAKPQHELFLPAYQIGKYPVTNAEFEEFIDSGGYKDKQWWTEAGWAAKEIWNWIEPQLWDDLRLNKPNQPVVGVSWYECLAYCCWLGAKNEQPHRLPSEAEWEKAARGTKGHRYPWGERFDPSRLNCWEGDQKAGITTPVGIYPTGTSLYGCQDMAGNTWEWTSSLWGKSSDKIDYKYPYVPGDGRESLETGDEILRVLRGGCWYLYQNAAQCSYRGWSNINYRGSDFALSGNVGFRVLVSPISAL